MESRIDVHPVRAQGDASSRALPAALFVAALLGFLLPFATVSCGTPVTFTGLQLATSTIPADGADEREFADEIESIGTVPAAVALGAVVIGLVLVAGRIGGWGVAAVTALLALLILPWLAGAELAEFELHEGYVLSVGALTAIAGIRRVESFDRRRARRRRRWPAILAGVALALPLVLTVLLAASSDV